MSECAAENPSLVILLCAVSMASPGTTRPVSFTQVTVSLQGFMVILYKWLFSCGINFRYIRELLLNAKLNSRQYLCTLKAMISTDNVDIYMHE